MKKLITLFLLLTTAFLAQSQSVILTQKIAVHFNNTPVELALKEIEKTAGVQFSYSSNFIDVNKKVSLKSSSSSIQSILNIILGEKVEAKARGKYIILQKKRIVEKKEFFIAGYVKDSETGQQISNASIYESLTLASALSNNYGFYKIKLPRNQKDIDLHFSKKDYRSEIINVFGRSDEKMDIDLNKVITQKKLTAATTSLQINPIKVDSTPNNLKEYVEMAHPEKLAVAKVSEERKRINIPKIDLSDELQSIDNTFHNGKNKFIDWFLSTKQSLHRNNITDSLYKPVQVSFLPFLGTNMSLSPFVTNDYSFNIIAGYTGNVRKLEVGSALNVVRYNMTGVQLSGGMNVVGRKTAGIQLAGGTNVNLGTARGFIASGGTNIVIKQAKGLFVAGGGNIALSDFNGLQLAPFNYATRLRGTQIGITNFAYEATGTPIGLFSYVHKNGYRRLEIGASELNATEVSFKTGVKRFYNIFSAAYNYEQNDKLLIGAGYGIGTVWNYSRIFSSNVDLVGMGYLTDRRDNYDFLSLQFKASLGLEAKITKRLAVFVAPTINVLSTNSEVLNFNDYPGFISERNSNTFDTPSKTYSWIGYKFGIRICNKGDWEKKKS
ncbi:MAG: hypothetical protein ACI97P_001575 [Arcticibacterium sp.]|jgi:hypothetical protein